MAIRPQLGDLESVRVTARTVRGPVTVAAQRAGGVHRVEVTLPETAPGELQVPGGTGLELPVLAPEPRLGLARYRLAAGTTTRFEIPSSVRG